MAGHADAFNNYVEPKQVAYSQPKLALQIHAGYNFSLGLIKDLNTKKDFARVYAWGWQMSAMGDTIDAQIISDLNEKVMNDKQHQKISELRK